MTEFGRPQDDVTTADTGTDGQLPPPAEIIPHRDPFLFVSALTAYRPGEQITGYWDLSGSEDFFRGHFPGRPTLPGVLMVEALAQLGACAVLLDERFAGKLPLFGGADKVKFRRQVVPGERLELEVTIGRLGSRAGKASGVARVGEELATQAELLFVVVDA